MKVFKGISLIITTAILVILTIVSVGAETIYQYYGFSYTLVDNYSISLVGWDNRADTFTLPNDVNERNFISVGNYALENNTFIKSVDLTQAKKLNRIGINAFNGCTGLNTEFVIPESVTIINNCAFQGCSSLPKAVINANITEIPNQCFYKCSSLAEVNIPDTVEEIKPWAFADCTVLEYVEIPKSVKSIAVSAFLNDPNLVLGVYKNTYALQYAEENQIDHIIIDGDKIGDVNGDGVVDILDATEIQKYAAESTDFTDEQFELGDINDDGYCDVIDALLVQKSVIGAYELSQNIIRY